MAQRRTHVVNQLQSDATEFGVAVRCGGWRLGLLVARNVEPGSGGPRKEPPTGGQLEKVSARQFAEMAGCSSSTVDYYYKAWQHAAEAKLVPAAGSIEPGDDDICIDADAIEVEGDPRTQWSWFYSMAKNPPQPKPKETEKDSKPKDSKQPEPTIQTDSSKGDDESVDDDFGIGSFTKEQVREADSSIQRNKLLEILESVRAAISRVEQAGKAQGENDAILGQISSAALDLMSTANAMVTVKEDAPNV